jgi:hypothetical protein
MKIRTIKPKQATRRRPVYLVLQSSESVPLYG